MIDRLLYCSLLLSAVTSSRAETPMLAIPGAMIYESKLDATPAAPWKVAKGKWEGVEGAVKGAELPEDKHGAVMRLPNQLKDFTVEYEFKFEGARTTSLSINAVKDHMARISITPTTVTFQKDDNDHDGPDKAVVFARLKADIQPGTWHKVRLDMVGDQMYGQVDEVAAAGSDPLFKTTKAAPGFTVGRQSVSFRNLTIREATLNPEWEKVRASLPKGEPAPSPAPKGAGGKKGAKKTAAK